MPKLKRKYTYASSGLFIRPAEGPEDLLKEGCAQHNCVYSCYTKKYLDRKTDILFVRKQSAPDQSYVTVEFKDGAVIQCEPITTDLHRRMCRSLCKPGLPT